MMCSAFLPILLNLERISTRFWKAYMLKKALLTPKLYSLSSCNVLIIDKLETYK